MKVKFIFLLSATMALGFLECFGQVCYSTDGSSPDASSMLEIKHASKGILIPRVALTGTSSPLPITSPATSLLVYNTASVSDVLPGYYSWNGTVWVRLYTRGASGIANYAAYWTTSSNLASEQYLSVSRGGTGIGSYTTGDLLYASGAGTLSKLAGVAVGNALISGGVGVAPSWGVIGLSTHVSGQLPVANGGTGASTLTGMLKGNGTSPVTGISGTTGYVTYWADANTIAGEANLAVIRGGTNGSSTPTTGTVAYGSGSAFAFTNAGTTGLALTSNGSGTPTWSTPSDGTAWKLTGNSPAAGSDPFLGTTNNQDLVFKMYVVSTPVKAGWLDATLDNTSFGTYGLYSNTSGSKNVAFGRTALYSNTIGNSNTAVGTNALVYNTTASCNTAVGDWAMHDQSYSNSGTEWQSFNTGIGLEALRRTQPTSSDNGIGNTGVGGYATAATTTGYNNTSVGHNSGPRTSELINTGSFGWSAYATASSTFVFGYSSTVSVLGWGFGTQPGNAAWRVGTNGTNGNGATLTVSGIWTNGSDSTKKYGIRNIPYGLKEVLRLHPVSYRIKGKNSNDIGFLAQEVKPVIPEVVYGKEGQMTLSYEQLTAVLAKAKQEQQQIIREQMRMIEELEKRISLLEKKQPKHK